MARLTKRKRAIFVFAGGLYLLALWPIYSQTIGTPFNPYSSAQGLKVGDVLHVRIDENTRAQYTFEFNRSRSQSVDSSPDQNITEFLPKAQSTRNTSDDQDGELEAQSRFTAAMSVLVSRKNDDGTFRVDGVKILNYDGQTSSVQLRGIVHPRDISDGYLIPASKIANLSITFQGKPAEKNFPLQNLNYQARQGQEDQGEQGQQGGGEQDNQNQAQQAQGTQGQRNWQLSEQDRQRILRQYLQRILGHIMDQEEQQ